jgi:hypothetical protein
MLLELDVLAQVVGSKHIWIAPPDCELSLAEVDVSEESDSADGEEQVGAAVAQYMDNTTHIDVFKVSQLAGTDTVNVLPERMRPLVQEVLPRASQAILQEGDMLFMPPK